jgi:hypothetical protein
VRVGGGQGTPYTSERQRGLLCGVVYCVASTVELDVTETADGGVVVGGEVDSRHEWIVHDEGVESRAGVCSVCDQNGIMVA